MIALPATLVYVVLAVLFSPNFFGFFMERAPYLKLGDLFPYLAVTVAANTTAELICYFFGIRETRLALKLTCWAWPPAPSRHPCAPLLFVTMGLLTGGSAASAVGEIIRLAFTLAYLRRLLPGVPYTETKSWRVRANHSRQRNQVFNDHKIKHCFCGWLGRRLGCDQIGDLFRLLAGTAWHSGYLSRAGRCWSQCFFALLDCLAIVLIASMATALMRPRLQQSAVRASPSRHNSMKV